MRFSEIPPVYARLAGFVAGALAQRVGGLVPGVCQESLSDWTRPVRRTAAKVVPAPLQRGWDLAMNERNEPPVLIVPGFMGPAFLLFPLATFLRLHGRTVRQMITFPALGGVREIASRVEREIEALRRETGAERVDVVTHSMGGLAGRYYMLKLGGHRFVRRFVSIATPHHGTNWAHLGFTQSLKDMVPGNPLLRELAPEIPVPGVKCLNIRAGWDQIVWPRDHGRWGEHATEYELPFAEHWAVQADVRLLALVLTELEAADEDVLEGTIAMDGEAAAQELGNAG